MSDPNDNAAPATPETAPMQGFLNQEVGLRRTVIGVYNHDSIERRLNALRSMNVATATFSDKEHKTSSHPNQYAIVVDSTVDLEPDALTQMREKARSA